MGTHFPDRQSHCRALRVLDPDVGVLHAVSPCRGIRLGAVRGVARAPHGRDRPRRPSNPSHLVGGDLLAVAGAGNLEIGARCRAHHPRPQAGGESQGGALEPAAEDRGRAGDARQFHHPDPGHALDRSRLRPVHRARADARGRRCDRGERDGPARRALRGQRLMFALASLALLAALGLALARAVGGPTVFDRALAANSIGTLALLMLAVFGFLTERPEFLDLAILYGLLNVIGTIAVLKFFRYGDLGDPGEDEAGR